MVHGPIYPDDNHVTVCVIKTVGTQPNVRVIADDLTNEQVAAMLHLIADDIGNGTAQARTAANKN